MPAPEPTARLSEIVPRQTFGLDALDRHLGGGLRPGTLTLVAGATGAGKTQLGLRWAAQGLVEERRRGVLVDLTSRGDPQNHEQYASSLHDWRLMADQGDAPIDPARFWDRLDDAAELFRPFARTGRRVTRPDLDSDAWDSWKRDLARVLRASAAFAYGHMVRGVRRVVVDGLEPVERSVDSIQLEFLDYFYHRVLRQDDDWAAREVFREGFRSQEARVLANRYASDQVGCLVLYTTPEVLLDDLLAQPIGQGNLFATANTVLALGRTQRQGHYGRALCVVKHRGSACSDSTLPFQIGPAGIEFINAE